MIHRHRSPATGRPTGRLVATLLASVLLATACGSTAPAASPRAPTSAPTATAAPSTAAPTTAPTATPAPPTAPSTAATACEVSAESGRLPSDRLTDVVITEGDAEDLVTFVFGESSIGSPAGAPEGSLEAIDPPYTQAASGLEIEMRGEHVVQLRFEHMSLANDVGQPVYDGDLEFRPDLRALTDVVNYDMSEGIVGWLVGWDGPGCITLETDGRNVTVAIAHAGS